MRAMHFVLTVIGAPDSRLLDASLIDAVLTALGEAGAAHASPSWLDPGRALEVAIESALPKSAEAAVRERLHGTPVDVVVLPAENRRKALLVADMESTIIAEELLDEMAETMGIRDRIAAITARSMAGELDFEAAIRERMRLLSGLPAATLDRMLERITLNPGARTLVQTMRAHGAHTALVSGGFTHFTEAVMERCGFHEAHGNRLILDKGALTGEVAAPILGPSSKREILQALCETHRLAPEAACAVGDGSNDVPMIQLAGLGVAYRAKSILRRAAKVTVEHGDLTAILYLQGYRREDFVG
jgi:phosphoserine phosphatase